ncbi:MAG TPA: NADP-dependent malic enzyme [Methylomirabilota bacterium]|nr:NADP-dependent malic enzyme [Methylomirabilota bacterium]
MQDRVPSPTEAERLRAANKPVEDALRLHPAYKGKIQTVPKCPIRGLEDFSVWYTPGVAAPCKAIQADPAAAYLHTNKGNTVAIVSDGTRVLGLGDIGPLAGLPVMEGKALLFKYLGGVDAVPICLDTKEPDEIVRIVRALAPSFGGINLEDISQPKCFRILDALRNTMPIPVWHDDQQGSATVLLAGLLSALRVVGKDIRRIKIAMIGTGAANISVYRLLVASGVDPHAVIACDSKGTLHPDRQDIAERQAEYRDKWRICRETNPGRRAGGPAAALDGADVCIAFSQSGPGVIQPQWIGSMARDAIVFACANPVPEIWPWEAHAAGARIVATGRSDFPNQVNNSLVFPGVFRGVLDCRARTITDTMAIAAAAELVRCAERRGLADEAILPPMDDADVAARVAAATGVQAQVDGVSGLRRSYDELHQAALTAIGGARRATDVLMREGVIAPPPS